MLNKNRIFLDLMLCSIGSTKLMERIRNLYIRDCIRILEIRIKIQNFPGRIVVISLKISRSPARRDSKAFQGVILQVN